MYQDEEIKPVKPWTDETGEELPLEQLRELSKNWDAETWEAHLQSLEKPRLEHLMKSEKAYRDLAEKYTIWDCVDTSVIRKFSPGTYKKLKIILDTLTTKERYAIKSFYWEGISEREIAKNLGISRSTVQGTLRRAKRKIRTGIVSESTKKYRLLEVRFD